MSKKRLEECHGFWIEDIRRALNESFPTDVSTSPDRSLDIFKYASFLSFWLRRFTPIVRIVFIVSLGDRVRGSLLREHDRFAIFGNEIAALLVGIHLCVFHVINIVRTSGNVTGSLNKKAPL